MLPLLLAFLFQISPADSSALVTRLEFREFFDASSTELKPSPKLLSLNGRRVRIAGFMAQMEDAPEGAFYLCPRPVVCDESGGGIGDLPVEAVRVLVPSVGTRRVKFLARPIEVTGILRLNAPSAAPAAISLILDSPQTTTAKAHRSRRPAAGGSSAITHPQRKKEN